MISSVNLIGAGYLLRHFRDHTLRLRWQTHLKSISKLERHLLNNKHSITHIVSNIPMTQSLRNRRVSVLVIQHKALRLIEWILEYLKISLDEYESIV